MPAHQAFSKLHYEEHRSDIDASWDIEVRRLRNSNPALRKLNGKQLEAAVSDQKLSFTVKELKRLYAEAPEEVKSDVEAYRQKHKSYVDISDEDRRVM